MITLGLIALVTAVVITALVVVLDMALGSPIRRARSDLMEGE